MSKIIVIVVTYNGLHWIDNCIGSLMNSIIPLKVIAIDNGSTDGTPSTIRSNFPTVEVIETGENLGFGKANNIGLKRVLEEKADYAFLLNQDAWVEPNTISGLVELSKNNSKFGIVSPIHLNAGKTAIEKTLMLFIANHRMTNTDLINDLYFNKVKDIYETNYINAAAWLIPRNTLEVVGGFDPIFFHYGEDDNYMHRVHYHGLKIGLCPLISIVHDTERRVVKEVKAQRSVFKNLLWEYTNINEAIDLDQKVNFYLRKAIFKLLRLSFGASKHYFSYYSYISNLKTAIEMSRNQNIKKESSWLID